MAAFHRIALLAAVCAGFSVPAAAQFNPFGLIFGNPPQRPPANVPNRPGLDPDYPDDDDVLPPPTDTRPQRQQQPQYQQRPQYPSYPSQTRLPPPGQQQRPVRPGGIQSQPLPPPPGGSAAPPNAPQAPGQPSSAGLPPGQRGTPQPSSTAVQPGDEVVTQVPSEKIANPTAVFSGLDKITGRIITFDVAIDETVQFGALQVTPRACYTRPATDTPNTDAFIEVDEVTLQGEVKRIFTGWMFAASPGLHAVEHPIYDVWLVGCKKDPPTVTAGTQPAKR